jgi:hypothetical protein
MMSRWLLVLLAVLLPLQLAWANVAHGCEAAHHQPSSEQHAQGHHEHAQDDVDSVGDSSDAACEHHCHPLPLLAPTPYQQAAEPSLQQLATSTRQEAAGSLPSRPERPKWLCLA